ncbi:hypothetical protein ACFRR6_31050 [Streptomyces sp. NPDC056891]|uniref:hypothetical protein n=1 Tax=Streptomyces sp. NPDC056891 TaxID=3345961 RepID=UPI003681A8CA
MTTGLDQPAPREVKILDTAALLALEERLRGSGSPPRCCSDPAFVSCPTAFHDPVFREPTPEETRMVTRRTGGAPPVLVAVEADAHGAERARGLIAAEALDIVEGTVLRY